MIEVDRLTVHYGSHRAVSNMSLSVAEGELFGILGPNGAGKTTLFSVLSGQCRPTRGRATVGGFDTTSKARKVQAMLGIVPQTFAGYEVLSALENMQFFGTMYRMPRRLVMQRSRELLGLVSLQGRAHDPVSSYSGGMRHRLNIVLGLIHEPKVVIMDEPTTGLDPLAREELWSIIRDLRARGVTILLTTHYMQEAETLCDRVAILDRGQVRLVGRPRDLGDDLEATFRDCVTMDDVTDRRGAPVAKTAPTRLKQRGPDDAPDSDAETVTAIAEEPSEDKEGR